MSSTIRGFIQRLHIYLPERGVKLMNYFISQTNIKGQGLEYCRLDGSTPTARRQVLVDNFNSDPNIRVFLISTRAGGVGLNLTGANTVVIFDPNWNPSHDLQVIQCEGVAPQPPAAPCLQPCFPGQNTAVKQAMGP